MDQNAIDKRIKSAREKKLQISPERCDDFASGGVRVSV